MAKVHWNTWAQYVITVTVITWTIGVWKKIFQSEFSRKNSQYSSTTIKSSLGQIEMSLLCTLFNKIHTCTSVVLWLLQFNSLNFSQCDTMTVKKVHWIKVLGDITHLHICWLLCLLIHRYLNLWGTMGLLCSSRWISCRT